MGFNIDNYSKLIGMRNIETIEIIFGGGLDFNLVNDFN